MCFLIWILRSYKSYDQTHRRKPAANSLYLQTGSWSNFSNGPYSQMKTPTIIINSFTFDGLSWCPKQIRKRTYHRFLTDILVVSLKDINWANIACNFLILTQNQQRCVHLSLTITPPYFYNHSLMNLSGKVLRLIRIVRDSLLNERSSKADGILKQNWKRKESKCK